MELRRGHQVPWNEVLAGCKPAYEYRGSNLGPLEEQVPLTAEPISPAPTRQTFNSETQYYKKWNLHNSNIQWRKNEAKVPSIVDGILKKLLIGSL